jgi:hypothetical protein
MNSFFKAKTTIAGMATLAGTLSGYLQGQLDLKSAITAAAFALVLIIFPEEKALTSEDIGSLVGTLISAASLVEAPKTKQVMAPRTEPAPAVEVKS